MKGFRQSGTGFGHPDSYRDTDELLFNWKLSVSICVHLCTNNRNEPGRWL